MADKRSLSESLQRLLRRQREEEQPVTNWAAWFESEKARRASLQLHRADGESYTSLPLTHRIGEGGRITLVVDALLPAPPEDFWHEPVTLHGEMRAFEAGVEEIVTFIASVGDRIEFEGRPAVELADLADLLRTTREYIAEPGDAYDIQLGFIWMEEWIEAQPDRISISRLFFDAELEGEIGPDGYAVPKATLRLETGGPEVPVKLRLFRSRRGGFEAAIETMDGTARQKLVSIVEEIWRIASGLGRRRLEGAETVGYRSTDHDPLAEAFETHAVLLGRDRRWSELLEQVGPVRAVPERDLEQVGERVGEARTDLIAGDADFWGDRAVQVERLLRSVSRFRDIPRIWFTNDPPTEKRKGRTVSPPGAPEGSTTHAPDETPPGDPGPLDLVDFGAWDLVDRELDEAELLRRFRWAMGGDAIGEGTVVMLVSPDRRMRYRLGVQLAPAGMRFTSYDRLEGLVQVLNKRSPGWLLLDATAFEVEMESLLAVTSEWTRRRGGKILVLTRGAAQETIAGWLRAGTADIVITDAALRDAAARLRKRITGDRQAHA